MEEKDEYLEKLLSECGKTNTDNDYNMKLLSKIHKNNEMQMLAEKKLEKKLPSVRERFSFYNRTTGLSFVTSGLALIALNIWGSKINEIIFLLKNIALNFNNILR
ncbi:MAG: hypothetical protein SO128_09400 [Clostridium cadaveris]|uniref:Uncharacterized protein n=1 Tax=Clostridium cadaveris TaxID=1529 RepID=A0A1I2PMA4_9CLOT|nr:hypothetical protein [Clostridium cadaveris]MDU4953118.1 hypothetical protein [Clostridium sp.]MDM8311716.1 hypothetical protein [Clostridium cadaveris]MDY4949571.1 hypothetical protein [Clostridium cadaveris]NME63490.1 hypothetical protein [Clostridium cadaveris]NWK09762.1 hypothetical protein [Clostridium cadaveris]